MTLLRPDSKVLGIIIARIGDTLLATPALRALRFGASRLDVLAHPKRVEVLQHLEFIDQLGVITKSGARLKGLLQRRRYDLAVYFGRDPALLGYCARVADKAVCFDYPELPVMGGESVVRVPVPAERSLHAVKERLLLAQAAGARSDDLRLAYMVTRGERDAAREWIARNVPGGSGMLIGLQPFSFPTKAHRDWPLEHFVELAKTMVQAYPSGRIILLGDHYAAAHAEAFERALPGRCSIAAGRLSLRQSSALMQQLSLYVGVDTGPTHIAGALRVPMVALYHPAYPGCNLKPFDHPRCIAIEHPAAGMEDPAAASMADITAGEVWAAVRSLLGERA